nr:DNA cytosine methyltransferase [Bifidobacterium moukalabense]
MEQISSCSRCRCWRKPCQAFSVAGLRKALADPRGQLMLEYLRACAEIDPEWIVWENVPGVLSAEHGRAFQSLLEAVAELWPDGGGGLESVGRSILRCGPKARTCVPCRQYSRLATCRAGTF